MSSGVAFFLRSLKICQCPVTRAHKGNFCQNSGSSSGKAESCDGLNADTNDFSTHSVTSPIFPKCSASRATPSFSRLRASWFFPYYLSSLSSCSFLYLHITVLCATLFVSSVGKGCSSHPPEYLTRPNSRYFHIRHPKTLI